MRELWRADARPTSLGDLKTSGGICALKFLSNGFWRNLRPEIPPTRNLRPEIPPLRKMRPEIPRGDLKNGKYIYFPFFRSPRGISGRIFRRGGISGRKFRVGGISGRKFRQNPFERNFRAQIPPEVFKSPREVGRASARHSSRIPPQLRISPIKILIFPHEEYNL